MVRDRRARRPRLILSLLVVLALGAGATVVAVVVSRSKGARRHPVPQPTTFHHGTHGLTTPPAGSRSGPLGVGGDWRLVFNSQFDGDSLNRGVWDAHNGWSDQNAVSDSRSNIAVRNGHAILMLASDSSGAELGTRHFRLRVGEFAEARIRFAGSGRTIYNWPAWWLSGPDWPQGGENDVAEGFGALTINYHSPSLTQTTGAVPGDWANHFHIFGIYRGRHESLIYWDGRLVRRYRTDDDGRPEMLLLTLGAGNQIRTGPAGAMIVDFVRAWASA